MSDLVAIQSTDFWVKIVDMLQQNWALIEDDDPNVVRVYFISDASGVFDEMVFPGIGAAREAMERNGFWRLAEDRRLQFFLRTPAPPFRRSSPEWVDLLVGTVLAIVSGRQ